MKKSITIIFICVIDIHCLYSQGFNTYAINKYSGGLTNKQNDDINLALWFKENAETKKKDRLQNSRKIILLQSQNSKSNKVKKLEKKQENLLKNELDNMEDAHKLFYDVYMEIINSLKKEANKQNEFFDTVKDIENNGKLLFKEGQALRKKNNNMQDLKQQNKTKQNAVEKEVKGLDKLLLAMEGYYDITQNTDKTVMTRKYTVMDSLNFSGNDLGENEIIVISKDALIHYSDRPEIYNLILDNYNVDTIDNFVSVPLYQLRNKQIVTEKSENNENNFFDYTEKYENPEIVSSKTDSGLYESPIEEYANNISLTQQNTEYSQTNTGSFDPRNNKSIKTGNYIIEYYILQILARKTPLPEKYIKVYYPGIQNIKMRYEEGWYKYQIGKFNSKEEAIEMCHKLKLNNSFVAMYKGEKRISIVYVLKNTL